MGYPESNDNKEMQEDMELLVNAFDKASDLAGSKVLVTGATGLLGSQVVRTLACFNRLKNTNIKVIAYVRNEEKARDMFGQLIERGDVAVQVGDINAPINAEPDVDYIIHGASATSSRYFVTNPDKCT